MTEKEIRSRFPALARGCGGKPVAYFDGPGGTQVPQSVVEAVTDYLYHHNANTHWAYPTSEETDAIVEGARATLADFFNATPGEIVFGANMTTLTFHLARALGRAWSPADEIIVTELDHHANIDSWRALGEERGLTVRAARMIPETGTLDWEHLASLLSPRTRLLAIGAASNALGTINDVRRAVTLARDLGALVFVDAVHYAAHALVDVRAMDCDFLACSAYKFYGPHLGVMYVRSALLETIDYPKLQPAPDRSPERAETGTGNFEGMAGAAAAVDFIASLGTGPTRRARLASAFAALQAHGEALFGQLWEGLESTPGVRVYGPAPGTRRTPTVSWTIDGVDSRAAAASLAARGVFVSHGNFYAQTVVERLGQSKTGLLRAGCACYTTADEVARLIEGVQTIAGA
jgi:cysteine desulfurase family protein (TIGR01976 family)